MPLYDYSPQQSGWNPLDLVASPVYNILDTVGGMPFINETGFRDWLETSPLTQGVRNFQDQAPGLAFATDIASMFVPFVGWGGAINKASRAANLGAGVLGLTNRAGQAAAGAFRGSPGLAFAVGEGVRYAPVSAAITGFDVLGGRYDNAVDPLVGFGLGTLGGGLIQWGGHALSPAIQRVAPNFIGSAWKAVFEPGPELSALYGFSGNVRTAAARAAQIPSVRENVNPTLEPQLRAGQIWDLLREREAGFRPEIDDEVAGVLRAQYDHESRLILSRQLDPVDTAVTFKDDPTANALGAVEALTRTGMPRGNQNRVRIQLTGVGERIDNPDVLARTLELPEGWVHDTDLAGLTQATLASATDLRLNSGLAGDPGPWIRVDRTTASGKTQTWGILPSADGSGYLVTTELPVAPGGEPWRMTGRAQHGVTSPDAVNEPARLFFSFKTHNPSRFFPEMRASFDEIDPGFVGRFEDRIPRGKSDFLDKAMDFRSLFLSRETIAAGHRARSAGRGAKERIVQEMLGGPTKGTELANLFETYSAPTDQQLKGNPEARGILATFQALFDAADGIKSRLLYGTASIPEGKGPITGLFSPPSMNDSEALITALRKAVQDDPNTLELIRRFDKEGGINLESIAGTPAGKWIQLALESNNNLLTMIDDAINTLRGIGATDARTISRRENHIGVSRRWDGANWIPIYREGDIEPVAGIAGHSLQKAKAKADAWVEAENLSLEVEGKSPVQFRQGKSYVVGVDRDIPGYIKNGPLTPGLLRPRSGLRGYEHEFEPYRHLDDFIKEFDEELTTRLRYLASTVADALTTGTLNKIRAQDSHAYQILKTRLAQLKGEKGPIDKRINQIVDAGFAKYFGSNSASKFVDGTNEFMFHLLHGAGNIATPMLNLTSIVQTHLPEAVKFLTSNVDQLTGSGYWMPAMGPDGLPTRGFHFISDPIGLTIGAFRRVINAGPEDMEVFQYLFNNKEMGAGIANEFVGQSRTVAARFSEGIRGPDDILHWMKYMSSFLMEKSEQVSRTIAAGMSLEAMARFEAMNGVKFTTAQKISNALKFVRRTNYGYFQADRPMMYTGPIGSLFGNQKTWMTNYMFMMAEYGGLGYNTGNWAPLMFMTGTTAMLGGVFAVPMLGMGIDAATEWLAEKDGREYIFEQFGAGGNGISFGLPALFGMSLAGNVSAPGSNLAHDSEFFFSIVALSKAQQIGRVFGRAWDDQVTLGLNPLRDEVFRQQFSAAFAPRSLYRGFEMMMSDQIRSSVTGNPMVRDLSWGQRVLNGLGFRDTETAIQYEAYRSLISDRNKMRERVALFGEAYALAMVNNDRQRAMELLQQATVAGMDISSVMRSAQTRMRNMGLDMFGRQFNEQQLEEYRASLAAGGRNGN